MARVAAWSLRRGSEAELRARGSSARLEVHPETARGWAHCLHSQQPSWGESNHVRASVCGGARGCGEVNPGEKSVPRVPGHRGGSGRGRAGPQPLSQHLPSPASVRLGVLPPPALFTGHPRPRDPTAPGRCPGCPPRSPAMRRSALRCGLPPSASSSLCVRPRRGAGGRPGWRPGSSFCSLRCHGALLELGPRGPQAAARPCPGQRPSTCPWVP